MKPAAPPSSPSHGKTGVASPRSCQSSPHHRSARKALTGTGAVDRQRRPFTAPRARILADLPPASGHRGPSPLHVAPLYGARGASAKAPGSLQPAGPLRSSSPLHSMGWDSFGETTMLELVGCSVADGVNTSLLGLPSDSTLSNWPALPGSAKPVEPLAGRLGGRKGNRRPESAPCISALIQPRGLVKTASGPSLRELAPSVQVPDSWEFVREPKVEEELLVQIPRPKSKATPDDAKSPEEKADLQVSFEDNQTGEAGESQEALEPSQGDALQVMVQEETQQDNLTALQATVVNALAISFSGGKKRVLRHSASAGSLPMRRYDRRYSRYAKRLPFVLREPFPDAPSDQLTSNICNIDALLEGRRAAWSKSGLVDETHCN